MRIKDRLTSFLFYCPVFNKKSCPILQTDKTIGTAWLNTAKRPLSLNTKSNAQLFSVLAFLVSNCAGSLASSLAGSLVFHVTTFLSIIKFYWLLPYYIISFSRFQVLNLHCRIFVAKILHPEKTERNSFLLPAHFPVRS